ncbi:MAG: ABC transporter permease subunit [Clostridia bacterium]
MKAILKREFRSYFVSPIGYVCVAVLACLYGFFYAQVMLYGTSSYISDIVYGSIFMFNLMLIPIITMKSLSEDKKNKTDQALLTAPVSTTGIIIGKFLGAFSIYFIGSTLGLLPAVAMSTFSSLSWGIVLGNYVATLLYGGAVISIGIFISSLTESQIIAAIATFVVSMFLLFMGDIAYALSGNIFGVILTWLSFSDRYTIFTKGIFSFSNALYFISVIVVFVFLTARKVESRRWN